MRRGVTPKWRPPLLLVLGGSLLAVLVVPVFGLGMVGVFAPTTPLVVALAAVGAGAACVALVLGWLLWRLILRPVRELTRRTEVIRAGGVTEPMVHFGTPETGSPADKRLPVMMNGFPSVMSS